MWSITETTLYMFKCNSQISDILKHTPRKWLEMCGNEQTDTQLTSLSASLVVILLTEDLPIVSHKQTHFHS
jgi:hypothetical protein